MSREAREVGLFPLPPVSLPYRPSSRSKRLWQRYHRSFMVTEVANQCVMSLNRLSSSFGVQAGNLFSSCSYLTSGQSRLLAHIYQCAARYVGRRATSSSEKLAESDLDVLLGDIRSCQVGDSVSCSFSSSSFSYANSYQNAVPLVADKVSLPSSVGSVDLLDFLPSDARAQYSSPESMLRPPEEVKRVRRSALATSHDEYVKLIRRMAALGMVEFTTTPKVVNGVFGVPKDGGAIRLIIDARPANSLFVEPKPVKLPTPDLLAQLVAPRDAPFYVAKVDLDNFYHRLRLPEWMRPYFALPPVSSSDVGLDGQQRVYPMCTTLPMGWSHSVLVAQMGHEHFISTRTNLKSVDCIESANDDLRLNRMRHQVYIDDLVLVGPDKSIIESAMREYINAATTFGLVVKMSKVVWPSSDGVEGLGLMVNGSTHEVGLSLEKLKALCAKTVLLLRQVTCSGHELSQVVGHWTWAALVNRPSLAVFNAVYRYIEVAGHRQFTLWPSVRLELVTLMGLAPLLFAKLDSSWFPRLIATDASEIGQGVVAVQMDQNSLTEVSKLDDESRCVQVQQVPKWSTIVSSAWSEPEHINVLELRAIHTSIRWVLSHRHSITSRVLLFSDSQVAVCSVRKGRSSSHTLLRRLRYLSALLLSSGIKLVVKWIPTHINPADEPSRKC
jgi:hypothetical protein